MSNLTGQSFGRYHILEQLGEGGMATVYKAYDTRLENDVAVKVIRTENLAPSTLERSLKRFEREAKALAKLTHSNIVKVLDYGEYEGKPYLVMPFLPGGTLKQRLKNKPIPYQEAARILIPIARALAFSHTQGMIHRDVKPANIMITESGDPMLTDFGIAKIIDEESTMDLTGTSSAVGTPEYMAPEQITSKTVDHRADIYSLGIVFYEMVTGRKPFQADTPMAVLFKHASEPLPRPNQFVANIPTQVEKILIKSLAKKPNDRYADMTAFSAALEELLGNKPQPPKGPTPKRPIREQKTFKERFQPTADRIRSAWAGWIGTFSSFQNKYKPSTTSRLVVLFAVALLIFSLIFIIPANQSAEVYYTIQTSAGGTGISMLWKDQNISILNPSVSSDSWYPAPDRWGNLYFVSTIKGRSEIYFLDRRGNKTQTTQTAANFESWQPAADGFGNLYFVSNQEDAKAEIYVIDAKGRKSRITHTPDPFESWQPASDGFGNVYFVSNQNGGKLEIYVIDSKGQKSQVTNTPDNFESWSPAPDGFGNLYFVSNQDGNAEIYAIDSRGHKLQITHTSGIVKNWSPVPGAWGSLYFTSTRNGKVQIFMMDSGGQLQVLADIPSNSWLKDRDGDPGTPVNTR